MLHSIRYDVRIRRIIFQILLVATLALLIGYFWSNAITNIAQRGLELGFAFLSKAANFAIGEHYIPYSAQDTYGKALLVGTVNTIVVAIVGCVLTTILGVAFGVMRLSPNPLLARLVGMYVELGRNIPLLLQLFFWYSVVTTLGGPRQAWNPAPGVFLSNRGLRMPTFEPNQALAFAVLGIILAFITLLGLRRWASKRQAKTGIRPHIWKWSLAAFIVLPTIGAMVAGDSLSLDVPEMRGFNFAGGMEITPEFVALVTGLTFYTTAFVTEIVRSGIQAVSFGQWEAGRSIGLTDSRIMRLIVLPQALRVIIPPLTSQYLNLTKNSSLAIAIGFPDLISVASTTINQTGQALEIIFIFMAVYLCLSLTISAGMNWLNYRVGAK